MTAKLQCIDSDFLRKQFMRNQCVCDMEWRAIKHGEDTDDCQCML